MITEKRNQQDRNRSQNRKTGKKTKSHTQAKTAYHYKTKYRIPQKRDVCTNLGSAEGGGNSPSAAKFSFARHGPCLRKDPALRCPRAGYPWIAQSGSAAFHGAIPGTLRRTGSEPPPQQKTQKNTTTQTSAIV